MASIVWTDVTDWDASLASGVSPNAQTLILADANESFNVAEFLDGESGSRLKMCRVLLAAHLGLLNKRASAGSAAVGTIASQSAGGLSRSYTTADVARREYGTTSHGQLLLALLRSSPTRAPLVV
jgi:hypothetical protein